MGLREDLSAYQKGDKEALSRKQEKTEKKKTPSLEEFAAKLSPKARESLYEILREYSYNDFKNGEDEEQQTEDDE
jgi:hypothetical protein